VQSFSPRRDRSVPLGPFLRAGRQTRESNHRSSSLGPRATPRRSSDRRPDPRLDPRPAAPSGEPCRQIRDNEGVTVAAVEVTHRRDDFGLDKISDRTFAHLPFACFGRSRQSVRDLAERSKLHSSASKHPSLLGERQLDIVHLLATGSLGWCEHQPARDGAKLFLTPFSAQRLSLAGRLFRARRSRFHRSVTLPRVIEKHAQLIRFLPGRTNPFANKTVRSICDRGSISQRAPCRAL
jgi:hypothetical protein